MAMLQRLRLDGVQVPYYSPLNEPQIAGDFPATWMHDVVVQLGQRMRAAGLTTKLVIPDDENPADAYTRAVAVLQDPNARQYVGALAYHIYKWSTADIVRMRKLARQYKLPLWMTEYSSPGYQDWQSAFDWAVRMHTLLTVGGVDAVDYLWGFFGSWVRTDTMLAINFENGVFRSYTPTPIYWITGQYSRFVRPGYVRVGATSSSDGVLVSAYTGGKRAVVVVSNPTESALVAQLVVTGGKLTGLARSVQSSATEHWKNLAALPASNGSFTLSLPPLSITTLVANRPG
jgi:glucuronoarabinoxylan endo-1,4-beta-xylanase